MSSVPSCNAACFSLEHAGNHDCWVFLAGAHMVFHGKALLPSPSTAFKALCHLAWLALVSWFSQHFLTAVKSVL